MFEKAAGVFLAPRQTPPGGFALGDILRRDQNAFPAILMPGKDATLELHIKAAAGNRVIDRVADEFGSAFPQLNQLLDMRLQHVLREDAVEACDEIGQV